MGRPLLSRPSCVICSLPVKRASQKTCSRICASRSSAQVRSHKLTLKCEFCGNSFKAKRSRAALQQANGYPVRFCSRPCQNESYVKNHDFVCTRCGDKKSPDEFFVDNVKRRGYVARCKSCYVKDRHDRLAIQAGRPRPDCCDICEEVSKDIVFDHCHATGRFRGWLCNRCNLTLGHVKDNKELLTKMISYLHCNSAITHDGKY